MYKIILMFKAIYIFFIFCLGSSLFAKDYVDYVNCYMGNISHTLVPSLPTIQLPNSMLRVYPKRQDFATWGVEDFALCSVSHRNIFSANGILPFASDFPPELSTLDNEKITPFSYYAILDKQEIACDFATSYRSAIYSFNFEKADPSKSRKIRIRVDDGTIYFDKENSILNIIQNTGKYGETKMYIALVFDSEIKDVSIASFSRKPEENPIIKPTKPFVAKQGVDAILDFADKNLVKVKYGVSFISSKQALFNLNKEIADFDLVRLKKDGRNIWNETLAKIKIKSTDEEMMRVFYTSFWRTHERMIDFNEYGNYYSAYDKKIHQSTTPFYCDDWIWDTYRTSHPLRVLLEPSKEALMLQSYIDMASQTSQKWLPTFPQIFGDAHAMNGNHIVASFVDAYKKGVVGFNIKDAIKLSANTLLTESIVPWYKGHRTELDEFYSKNGYFPGLKIGEKEWVEEVNTFERRQSVAVTLAASFDDWCVAEMLRVFLRSNEAKSLSKDDLEYFNSALVIFSKTSGNAKNLYKEDTGFFHPKDSEGNFIEPFDYRIEGGLGFRDYYDENNAWTYRWEAACFMDLVSLMGGKGNFEKNLDATFHTPIGLPKWRFIGNYAPDQTGCVGQFSMGNEPSFHIPYLYNLTDNAWKTQKAIRALIYTWFRDDLMGVPGDEDGGAMSAFVVWSMLGIYPDVARSTLYYIGSPFFEEAEISLENGKSIKIIAKNNSRQNKYVSKVFIDGEEIADLKLDHREIKDGATIVFEMSARPKK